MGAWEGRRVLVTGADGFIGSHLVERLVSEGARVRAFALYNSLARWGWLEPPEVPKAVLDAIEILPGDIRDADRVRQAVAGQETVFHLCSLIAIPYSYVAPESYVQVNALGAVNLLQACRDAGVARVVHTSTSEVYGTARFVPITLDHPLQGQSPYSASKIAADALAESFHRAYGLPVVTVRPFNTYGPRQSARAVIPTILSQLLSGRDRLALGSQSPTRDFTFVSDTVDGFVRAALCDRAVGQVLQLGSGTEVSIGDLARLAMEVTGRTADVATEDARLRPAASEVDRLCCDASRARDWLSWAPAVDLRAGLQRTADWLRGRLDLYKPDAYNV